MLDEEDIGFAYGALACGADIIAAEALLDRGVELQLVLPFEEQDFLTQSVRPGGPGWEARYRVLPAGARSASSISSPMAYFGNPDQYGYASRMAMGLACLRAEHLAAEAIQIAIWDGVAPEGPAGTGADVLAWQQAGGRTRSIDPGPVTRGLVRPPPRIVTGRRARAGGDPVHRFRRLLEAQRGGPARLLGRRDEDHRRRARRAWRCGGLAQLLGRRALRRDRAARPPPPRSRSSSRISSTGSIMARSASRGRAAGCGSARITAPLIAPSTISPAGITFYGTEVSKAARIEPVTPTGAVFVTEPFAAILALEAPDRFDCRYVGRIQLAKGYGSYPMYRLTRAD